jgi:uncharacterized protein YjbJ (UPF0337 family)
MGFKDEHRIENPARVRMLRRFNTAKEDDMNWDRIEGNWKQVKGKVREKWADISDNDLEKINGRRDQLEGVLQERYGLSKDVAQKNIDDWLDTMH